MTPYSVWPGEADLTSADRFARVCHIEDFDGADPTGTSDSSAALLRWLAQAQTAGVPAVLSTGVFIYDDAEQLLITRHNQVVLGTGAGTGLADSKNFNLPAYQPNCAIKFTATGDKYVQTRRRLRESALDPTDDPISACVAVQAEGVQLKGFAILLDCDFEDTDPTNYGADWDVGLLNGCRLDLVTEDLHIVGYHRLANYLHDVTRGIDLPELHPSFPRGTVLNGADGTMHIRPYWAGGRWQEAFLGPIRGESGQYWNEETLELVEDTRGSSGSSDYRVTDGHFYGVHHSGYRWTDPLSPLNQVNEGLSSGTQYIDAYAGNAPGRVTKLLYDNCRFESKEPFICRLDRVGALRYTTPHWEWRDRSVIPAAGGSPIDPSNTTTNGYGAMSRTSRTGTVIIENAATNLPSDAWFFNITAVAGSDNSGLIGGDAVRRNRLKDLRLDHALFVGSMVSADTRRLHLQNDDAATANEIVRIVGQPGSNIARFYSTGEASLGSVQAAALRLSFNTSTSRSISAGGTLNASGADYAEYFKVKPHLSGRVAKGGILGVAADGLLTDRFADIVGPFLVKSTRPNLVGNDNWSSEDNICRQYGVEAIGDHPDTPAFRRVPIQDDVVWADYERDLASYEERKRAFDAAVESERVKWDRMALSGQVPVNISASTEDLGRYLLPAETNDGGVTATTKNRATMTVEDLLQCIGQVVAIAEDGRPVVLVR